MLRLFQLNSGYNGFSRTFRRCNNAIHVQGSFLGRMADAYRKYSFSHCKKTFGFNTKQRNSLEAHNKIFSVDQGQGWNITYWLLMILGGFLACLSSIKTNEADAKIENQEPEIIPKEKMTKTRIVTKENFQEILDLLDQDSPFLHSLEFIFPLTQERLQKLDAAIQNNTELGYISWCEEWYEEHLGDKTLKRIEDKLIDNNRNYRHHPTDYIHGLLNVHVNQDSVVGDFVNLDLNFGFGEEQIKNWRVESVFDDKTKSGYYGVIYVNDKTHQVVLGIRGAEGGLMNLICDLFKNNSPSKMYLEEAIGGQIVVGQQKWNMLATKEAIKIAQEKGYRLSFTGHSLGGWLAELSVFYSHASNNPDVRGVTFDSPGSFPILLPIKKIENFENLKILKGDEKEEKKQSRKVYDRFRRPKEHSSASGAMFSASDYASSILLMA